MNSGGPVQLDALAMAIAATLVVVAGALSLALRLGLERRLALASARTVIQLLLVGYVLRYVFEANTLWVLAAVVGVMLFAGGRAAVARAERRYRGAYVDAMLTLTLCGLATTYAVTAHVVQVRPWYEPQYLIPLLGMVLGNGLTGISLCLDTVLERFDRDRAIIETELSLGATAWEAARDSLRDSVRRGMIPIINSMSVVGLVSLPGMMTGQILSGTDPLLAVRYQIVVMFMIAAATSVGCIVLALAVFRRMFNERHQLRAERIQTVQGSTRS